MPDIVSSLYVHIPFCKNVCGYCDFSKCRYDKSLADRYLDHLFKEIDLIKQDSFKTIYIGGGTPTSLNEQQLERLLERLSRFNPSLEFTIEINPETFTIEKAQLLKKYGINRVSIGIQSFNEKLLEHMERSHTNLDVENTMKYLDEVGIKNRSIDLIFGFKNQTLQDVSFDLNTAVQLNVMHISIYDLEIYPTTKFGLQNYQKLSEKQCSVMYDYIIDFLNSHSYHQYEVSNFSIDGYQSKHNLCYWYYNDYIGVGLSASGKIDHYRYTNTNNFVDYLKDKYRKEEIQLSDEDLYFETIMMNLRLNKGINLNDYQDRFGISLIEHYKDAVEKNVRLGLLEIKNNYLKTTRRGLFVLNDILVDFIK